MSKAGLYIHVPFCLSKCPYCDFYSVVYDKDAARRYADAVTENIKSLVDVVFDTVYFGGGTPILLHDRIGGMLSAARITENAEITVEANPCLADENTLCSLVSANVNRISFGVQSLHDSELKALGRRHNAKEALKALDLAYKAGIKNISADIMIGIPQQTEKTLKKTLDMLCDTPVTHISAYMLKIEPDTPFGKNTPELPSEDMTADMYLQTVEYLAAKGFNQYEISNFAKNGYECRHNLKYWNSEEYIGIGPAAHSFHGGVRYAVSRCVDDFLAAIPQRTYTTDDNAGTFEEWAMLKLRLCAGLDYKTAYERFGVTRDTLQSSCGAIPRDMFIADDSGIRLTPRGFLLSNAVIGILTDIN